MKLIIRTLSFLLFLGLAIDADAQKFGYINTQELISESPKVKEANSNIETYRKQLTSMLESKVKSLQAKYTELQRKQAQGDISPKQLEAEADVLKSEEAEIATFEKTSQEKLMKKSESLLKPLRDQIQVAIDQVAAENQFTYIFDASVGTILYANKQTDVTDLVKAKLGL